MAAGYSYLKAAVLLVQEQDQNALAQEYLNAAAVQEQAVAAN